MKKVLSVALCLMLLLGTIAVGGESVLNVLNDLSIKAHATEEKTQAQIPNDAVIFNGHSYFLFPAGTVSSWLDAKAHCENAGGYLAVISSKEENDFLYMYIKSLNTYSAYFGYSDSEQEGIWKWIKDEGLNYTNWHSGEPNGENSNEDYAEFYWKNQDGTWNDGNFAHGTVSDGNAFICEWENEAPIIENPSQRSITGMLETTALTIIMNGDISESYVSSLIIDGTSYYIDKDYSIQKTSEVINRYIGKMVQIITNEKGNVIHIQEKRSEPEEKIIDDPIETDYGVYQQNDRRLKAEMAVAGFQRELENYFSAFRSAATEKIGETPVDAVTFAKQLQAADKKGNDPYIGPLINKDLSGDEAPDDAEFAAYYALAKFMQDKLQQEISFNVDYSKTSIEIESAIVRQVQELLQSSGTYSYSYGNYAVEVSNTSFASAFAGSVTVTKVSGYNKGKQYIGSITSTSAGTNKVVNQYLDSMRELIKDGFRYTLSSIIQTYVSVIGLSQYSEEQITSFMNDKVKALQKNGFGKKLLSNFINVRSGYQAVISFANVFKLYNADVYPEEVGRACKNAYDQIMSLDFSDSGVKDKATKAAIKELKKAQKAASDALFDYIYETDGGPTLIDRFKERIGIKCPVEFELYDAAGALIGYIDSKDNHDDYIWYRDDIFIETDGETKYIYLPDNIAITIKLIAVEDGEMTYTIEEYNDGKAVGRLNYYEIPLSKGDTFVQTISSGTELSTVGSSLLLDGNYDYYPDEYISSNDNAFITVLCENDNGGHVIGEGEYAFGDAISLFAIPNEGYRFVGWYSNNILLSANNNYQFPATKNLILSPRFETSEGFKTEDLVSHLEMILTEKDQITLKPNESYEMDVFCLPSKTEATNLVWSSSNPDIVSVDQDGTVFAKNIGDAFVSIKDTMTGLTASTLITVISEGSTIPIVENFSIRNYQKNFSVNYKSTLIFHTTAKAPDGYKTVWSNGQEGDECKFTATKSEYKISAKLVNISTGETVQTTEEVTVKVSATFIAKIIAFFKGLFNMLPTYEDFKKQ